jgi:TPR repeat protein
VTYTAPMTNDRKQEIQAIGIGLGLLLLSVPIFSQDTALNARENAVHLAAKLPRTGTISWQNLRGETDYNRAVVFYKEGKYAQALGPYEKACESSYAAACTDLGVMNRLGQGLKRNYVRAAELYQRGCSGGNALGCINLGLMYWYNFLPKVDSHAAELFRQGCDDGDGTGCLALGFMYENGQGVPKDESRAANLYEQACGNGSGQPCTASYQCAKQAPNIVTNAQDMPNLRASRVRAVGLTCAQ